MFIGHELNGLFVVLCAFAAYRVAVLFAIDLGPLHVFWHIRDFFKTRSESEGKHEHDTFWRTASFKERAWRSLWELFDCQYCFGLWMSILIVLWAPMWLITILAVAGAQSMLHRITSKLEN